MRIFQLILKLLKFIIPASIIALLIGFLHFYLPSYDIVRITSTDVKRMDVQGKDFVSEGGTVAGAITRDVRYIYATWPDNKPRVYRNEDTGWGFPFYFKFDTSNLQAIAEDIKSTPENPKWVIVKHYGWRSTIFTMFPNAISIKPTQDPNQTIIPWFNIIFLLVLAFLLILLIKAIIEARRKHVDPLIEQIEDQVDDAYDSASKHSSGISKRISGFFGKK